MSIKADIEKIISDLHAAFPDAEKVDKGKTGLPGTRVRAAAQAAKKSLDDLRKSVQALRADGDSEE
jgi:hypothetical protein